LARVRLELGQERDLRVMEAMLRQVEDAHVEIRVPAPSGRGVTGSDPGFAPPRRAGDADERLRFALIRHRNVRVPERSADRNSGRGHSITDQHGNDDHPDGADPVAAVHAPSLPWVFVPLPVLPIAYFGHSHPNVAPVMIA